MTDEIKPTLEERARIIAGEICDCCSDYLNGRHGSRVADFARAYADEQNAALRAHLSEAERERDEARNAQEFAEQFCVRAAKAAGDHEFVCAETVPMRTEIANLRARLTRIEEAEAEYLAAKAGCVPKSTEPNRLFTTMRLVVDGWTRFNNAERALRAAIKGE